jgi:glc operon protein GlcG
MTNAWQLALLLPALAIVPGALQAQMQVVERPVLTLDGARTVAAAAVEEAKKLNAPGGAIAIVDDGGHLMYLERLDNTFAMAAPVAEGKARTAALFRRPTKGMEDAIIGGRTTLLNVAETPLQGGVPIVVNGVIVGAIGVSGAASADQDRMIADAAAGIMLRLTAR